MKAKEMSLDKDSRRWMQRRYLINLKSYSERFFESSLALLTMLDFYYESTTNSHNYGPFLRRFSTWDNFSNSPFKRMSPRHAAECNLQDSLFKIKIPVSYSCDWIFSGRLTWCSDPSVSVRDSLCSEALFSYNFWGIRFRGGGSWHAILESTLSLRLAWQ